MNKISIILVTIALGIGNANAEVPNTFISSYDSENTGWRYVTITQTDQASIPNVKEIGIPKNAKPGFFYTRIYSYKEYDQLFIYVKNADIAARCTITSRNTDSATIENFKKVLSEDLSNRNSLELRFKLVPFNGCDPTYSQVIKSTNI